ncbi:MAG: dTDP-4-dehydrorhamnose 3,5-epimerase [Woeseiaceae bacterium]|nr:dTDP-4-dehydrorhamnose 3,5-epimerase [Woeseiaceae bacterium]
MIFEPLPLKGSFLIRPEPHADARGFFARTFCSREFAEHGLNENLRQCSVSFNSVKHTLRGLHYQLPPHEEAKLVRCTQGAAHHVIVDLRDGSETCLGWTSVELNSDNHHQLYVPEGVAHGFITLADATEIFYQISADFSAEHTAGVRWDDPAFDIAWPADPAVISDRDSGYADYAARS